MIETYQNVIYRSVYHVFVNANKQKVKNTQVLNIIRGNLHNFQKLQYLLFMKHRMMILAENDITTIKILFYLLQK